MPAKQKGKASASGPESRVEKAAELLASAGDLEDLTAALATTQEEIAESLSAELEERLTSVQARLDNRLERGLLSLQTGLIAHFDEQFAQLSATLSKTSGGASGGADEPQEEPAPPRDSAAPAVPEVPSEPAHPSSPAGAADQPSRGTDTTNEPINLLEGLVEPSAADGASPGLTPVSLDFDSVNYLPPLLFSNNIGPGFDVLPHVTSSGKPDLFPLDTDLTFQAIQRNHERRNVPLHRNEPLLEYYVGYCASYHLSRSLAAASAALQDSSTRSNADGDIVMRRDAYDLLAAATKTSAAATGLIRDRLAHIKAKQTKSLDAEITDIISQTMYARPVAHLGSEQFADIHDRLTAELDKQIIIQGAKSRAAGKKPRRPHTGTDPKDDDKPDPPPKDGGKGKGKSGRTG